jgi:hypothetical protein
MIDSLMYGSLVLYATTPVQEFPRLVDANTIKGFHMENRFRGTYSLLIDGDFEEVEIPLPTRNKYLTVTALSEYEPYTKALTTECSSLLQAIDSMFEGARHLFKMQKMMDDLGTRLISSCPYLLCINNNSQHSYFTLLSQGVQLYVYGVYDTVNRSVRLVWTSDEHFITSCRAVEPTRYVFYRYPTLIDRPLFLHTQVLCSKWAEWSKVFTGPDGVLKAFNALELFLYKNPRVESYSYQPLSNG